LNFSIASSFGKNGGPDQLAIISAIRHTSQPQETANVDQKDPLALDMASALPHQTNIKS
jgi:hypothetical protein